MSTKHAKPKGSVAIPLDVMWSMAFRAMSLKEIHALIDEIVAAGRRTYVVTPADITKAKAKASTNNRRRP
jgi:hypothetical protein